MAYLFFLNVVMLTRLAGTRSLAFLVTGNGST
jgi:hypothetical protein